MIVGEQHIVLVLGDGLRDLNSYYCWSLKLHTSW